MPRLRRKERRRLATDPAKRPAVILRLLTGSDLGWLLFDDEDEQPNLAPLWADLRQSLTIGPFDLDGLRLDDAAAELADALATYGPANPFGYRPWGFWRFDATDLDGWREQAEIESLKTFKRQTAEMQFTDDRLKRWQEEQLANYQRRIEVLQRSLADRLSRLNK